MFNASKVFVASVTFLGCWFLHASSVGRASKAPDQEYPLGRAGVLGVLACGLIDLAMSAAMWCRDLGAVAGLAAWGFAGLASWTLIVLITGRGSPQGRQRAASEPPPQLSGTDAPAPAERNTTTEGSQLVAIFLFVAAILAFFKQLIETWNAG